MITAKLLTEVCSGVGTEPCLQPITLETLKHKTANREDGARLDVVAENFWGDRQRAFFDVRVFNPLAPSHRNNPLAKCYRMNEQQKKRAYDERIRVVEHGKKKQNQPYRRTLHWLRCKLSFSLLRSSIMCLRGARSSLHHPIGASSLRDSIDLHYSETKMLPSD